ncbi:MAG: 2-enoyl thioester reductase domain-containing protein [Verrucomicrobiota bacterium]|nr:2-enoyl thioester reductase domain-containing protein [Verrucomicrobiota bacterium]
MKSLALRYQQHGVPLDVLSLEEIALPDPGPGQALVKLLMASINPSDFGMVLGNYGKLKTLPAVAGREAVGEVVAVGSGVTDVKPGQRVRFPEDAGCWQTYCIAQVAELWPIPQDVPTELAAMAWVNPPTAWRLLRDGHLGIGDWVIQNAANSAVGVFVIQMAKHLGLRTVNVVRREDLIAPLKKLGADVVVLDNDEYPKNIHKLTGGSAVHLALNSVGGESAIRLVKSLSEEGKLVTFGAMSFEAVRFPTRHLIFSDISLSGFWMDRWLRVHSRPRAQIMFDKIFTLMRTGALTAPVEKVYPLAGYKEALAHAAKPRLGKILFRGEA